VLSRSLIKEEGVCGQRGFWPNKRHKHLILTKAIDAVAGAQSDDVELRPTVGLSGDTILLLSQPGSQISKASPSAKLQMQLVNLENRADGWPGGQIVKEPEPQTPHSMRHLVRRRRCCWWWLWLLLLFLVIPLMPLLLSVCRSLVCLAAAPRLCTTTLKEIPLKMLVLTVDWSLQ